MEKKMYHVNLNTGEPGVCRATVKPCPFGGDSGKENHYPSLDEAKEASENALGEQWGHTSLKQSVSTEEEPALQDHGSITGKSNSTRFIENCDHLEMSNTELLNYTGETTHYPDLGITTSMREGYLVRNNYFSPTEVRGTIDYNELDEESYKAFGFAPVESNMTLMARIKEHQNPPTLNTHVELSDVEMDELDLRERKAFNLYSMADFYDSINSTLHDDDMSQINNRHNDPKVPDVLGSNFNIDEFGEEYDSAEEILTRDNYVNIIDHIDSGFSKGPGEQRILYRGVSSDAEFLMNHGGIDEYVDDNLQLGTEIEFNGYQSASSDPKVSLRYSGELMDDGRGLVYEILTPAGINMSSVSEFDDEKEVLLPRRSRYMVVGKHKTNVSGSKENDLTIVQLVAVNENGAVLTSENTQKPLSLSQELEKTESS